MTDYSKYDNHIFKFIVANERWFEKADKDSDGILLSGEFASYFESSMNFEDWDGEVTNSNDEKDILKNFFARMIDTNKAKGHIDGYKNIANEFAADVTEIDAFKNGKIASYNEILNVINVYCPDYIENKESWKSKVTGQIVSLYGNSSSNVENFVDTDPCQDVLAQVTSEMLLKQCLEDENFAYITIGNTALTTLIASDTTLKSLIETYVENVCDDANTKFDSDQMEKDIKGIINEYFNYAGLDNLNIKLYDSANDSTDDNVIATYDGDIRGLNNSLTSLQTEVAKAEISSRVIKGFQEEYLDYYSNFQSYVKSFVTSVISEVPTGSWENNIPDWDSLAMKFETSTQKTNLDNYIETLNNPTPPVEEEPEVEKEIGVEEESEVDDIPEIEDTPEDSICAETVYKDIENSKGSYLSEWHKRASGYRYADKIAEEIENDLVYWLSKGKTYDYDEMKTKDEFGLTYSQYNENIYSAIDKTRNLYAKISTNSEYDNYGVKVYRPDPETNQYDYKIDFQETRSKFLEFLKIELDLI